MFKTSTRTHLAALLGAATLAGLAMPGTASATSRKVGDTEQMLLAAGFNEVPAAAVGAQLSSLPPDHIVAQPMGARFTYAYSDPTGCDCVLVGSPDAYSRYQSLKVQKDIAEQNAAAAQDRWADRFAWNSFYNPYFYNPYFGFHFGFHDHDHDGDGHH